MPSLPITVIIRRTMRLLVCLLLLCVVTPGWAKPGSCAAELRACLALSIPERVRCLSGVAEGLTCHGTPLGELAERRSLTDNPFDAAGDEGALAFLGERLSDPECLTNFDNLWSSYLLKGEPSTQTLELLHTTLDGCLGGGVLDLPLP